MTNAKSEQFEAQKKAITFQEQYYPESKKMTKVDQSQAIRIAYAQGFEMAKIKYSNNASQPSD
jgi:hypothetical protein